MLPSSSHAGVVSGFVESNADGHSPYIGAHLKKIVNYPSGYAARTAHRLLSNAGQFAIILLTATSPVLFAAPSPIEQTHSSISIDSGFLPGTLLLNGSASVNEGRLRLTDGVPFETGSAYSPTLVNIQSFANDFVFQLTNAAADGFTFVIQNQGARALGDAGGGLGFGSSSGAFQNSVALKFDLFNNAGEGNNSTGLFVNGSSPTTPATDLTGSGLNIQSGHAMRVHMIYNGQVLVVKTTDTITNAFASQSYVIDIPAIVGANSAFVGFTGGTGGLSAVQDIVSWDFVPSFPVFGPGALSFNGSAFLAGNKIRMTDGGNSESSSVFTVDPVNLRSFTNDFSFQLVDATADGFTFTIQNSTPLALGWAGSYLGYGPAANGFSKSIAIKFDLFDNEGEGRNSTGIFINGSTPTVPGIDLSSMGIDLHSGNQFDVHMAYDGIVLSVTLKDRATNASATQRYAVDIPSVIGSDTAFVGFTAGTGGLSATQDISSWAFTAAAAQPQPPVAVAAPNFSPSSGNFKGSVDVSLFDSTPNVNIYYTLDGTIPSAASSLYRGPIPISGDSTINAIASWNGASSSTATASYTISPDSSVGVTSSQVIKHIVVIFDENVSFDHYFGTYPTAANPPGETSFTANEGTPAPNGLTGSLLTANANSTQRRNGAGATNPFRLDPRQASTADQDHNYTAEQTAFDNGAMDLFPYSVGVPDSNELISRTGASAISGTNGLTMGYFDGNTVTALWNYAQRYTLNDQAFATNFGPSTPGAINLVSGQTNGVVNDSNASSSMASDGYGGFSLIGDPDPVGDLCSSESTVHMTGNNIGVMLNAARVSWGFFAGGFDLSATNTNGSTGCGRNGLGVVDYIPHHEPFQYYSSTSNPNHKRPSSVALIGTTDDANHQYDLHDFTDALNAGVMPSVSFLKPVGSQDGHAGYSNPLREQNFLVDTINTIQQSKFWDSTAVIVLYDDSDGWYDHVANIVNGSASSADADHLCGTSSATPTSALPGVDPRTLHAQGRCGYGPRIPFLVISPWAKKNAIDSTTVDQTSVLRFVEDTFLSGTRIGQGSFDSLSGSINNMFDFTNLKPQNSGAFLLDPTSGSVVR